MGLISKKPSPEENDATCLTGFTTGQMSAEIIRRCTLPAEWFKQSIVQLTWPHAQTDWCELLPEVTACYVRMAYEIASRQPLLIIAPDVAAVRSLLATQLPTVVCDNIQLVEAPTNDTWARDHAFITCLGSTGPELLDFRFNGWGGKFEASLDNAINQRVYATGLLHGTYIDHLDFELEGGSIESDGQGTLLVTSTCLLTPTRNPQYDRTAITEKLCQWLGIDKVLWLDYGYLAGDDTDSHIDTLARLCPADTIVYVQCTDDKDEHYMALQQMEAQLQTFTTAQGRPFRLLPLPMARPILADEERLPATYANFLILNTAILYPTYADPERDELAARVLRVAFPKYDIVGIDCRILVRQHGSLHCATMQYPIGVFRG